MTTIYATHAEFVAARDENNQAQQAHNTERLAMLSAEKAGKRITRLVWNTFHKAGKALVTEAERIAAREWLRKHNECYGTTEVDQ